MSQPTTIQELVDLTAEYELDRSDMIASSKSLEFISPMMTWEEPSGLFKNDQRYAGELSQLASRQIAERLNAPPASWLFDTKDCPLTLFNDIMNDLTGLRDDSNLLIRSKGQNIRAVLSDQYSPFDSDAFTTILQQGISATPNLANLRTRVVRTNIGDHMKSYVLFPDASWGEDPRGGNHPLHPAVHISNDEVGRGKFRISAAVFSSFCENGVIFGWGTKDEMAITHRWFHDDDVIIRLAAHMIAESLQMTEVAANMFLESFSVKYKPVEVENFLDTWAKKGALSQLDRGSWEQFMTLETSHHAGLTSLGDLVNGLTAFAQTKKDPKDTEDLERLAGDMLSAQFVKAAQRQMVSVEE